MGGWVSGWVGEWVGGRVGERVSEWVGGLVSNLSLPGLSLLLKLFSDLCILFPRTLQEKSIMHQ